MKHKTMQIEVCLNENKVADRVIELARKHARAFQAEIHLITAYTQRSGVKQRDADNMQKADLYLEKIRQRFLDADIKCVTRLLVNDLSPGENILAYAAEHRIDQIIIGIEKTSKVGKAVFGSTAQYVILSASCPVVCVR